MYTIRSNRTMTISIPRSLYRDTITTARHKGKTLSEIVREALKRYLRDESEWIELHQYGKFKAAVSHISNNADIRK